MHSLWPTIAACLCYLLSRVYATPPKSAKLPSGGPLQNLIGFTKVEISKGDSKTVDVTVDSTQLETAMPDGTRALVAGKYVLSVGGHQPNDAEGTAGSSGKVVSATITVD